MSTQFSRLRLTAPLHPAAGMILEITYGRKVESVDDEFIRIADEAATESFRFGALGGTAPCDIIPIREHNFTLLYLSGPIAQT